MGILAKLKEGISKLTSDRPEFDPSTLNDEIAMKTEWGPAKSGGTNVCTHSLKELSSGRFEFKIRGAALFFPGVFMVIGITVPVVMIIAGVKQDIKMLYFGIPFGCIFFAIGFFILRSWSTPRVFDFDVGYYWKGRNSPLYTSGNPNEQCQLKDIHAIQLLQEFCRSNSNNGGGSSYYSYELNLVLKDGTRLNVIDHGKLSVIAADAKKLSQFLNIPVWDATFQ